MNQSKYDEAYAAAQAGGMNNTDSDEFATDQATRKADGRTDREQAALERRARFEYDHDCGD